MQDWTFTRRRTAASFTPITGCYRMMLSTRHRENYFPQPTGMVSQQLYRRPTPTHAIRSISYASSSTLIGPLSNTSQQGRSNPATAGPCPPAQYAWASSEARKVDVPTLRRLMLATTPSAASRHQIFAFGAPVRARHAMASSRSLHAHVAVNREGRVGKWARRTYSQINSVAASPLPDFTSRFRYCCPCAETPLGKR